MLQPIGLVLSPAKTQIVHMSVGFDFLGFHIRWGRPQQLAHDRRVLAPSTTRAAVGELGQQPRSRISNRFCRPCKGAQSRR